MSLNEMTLTLLFLASSHQGIIIKKYLKGCLSKIVSVDKGGGIVGVACKLNFMFFYP